jgi:hypothetical protein
MTLSHLSRLGLDDDAVRCQWWMEMMTRKHQSLSLWRNRGSKACHWMAILQRVIDVCTVAGNRPFAQRLAAWIALSLPRGYVARASWVEPAGFPIALLRREPRAGWVELAAGSTWNRFRDCVVRTRPFSRRQGNVHEALPGAVARAPARFFISLQCFPVAVAAPPRPPPPSKAPDLIHRVGVQVTRNPIGVGGSRRETHLAIRISASDDGCGSYRSLFRTDGRADHRRSIPRRFPIGGNSGAHGCTNARYCGISRLRALGHVPWANCQEHSPRGKCLERLQQYRGKYTYTHGTRSLTGFGKDYSCYHRSLWLDRGSVSPFRVRRVLTVTEQRFTRHRTRKKKNEAHFSQDSVTCGGPGRQLVPSVSHSAHLQTEQQAVMDLNLMYRCNPRD